MNVSVRKTESKFQTYQRDVLDFLQKEDSQTDEKDRLIYAHQTEALLKVKECFDQKGGGCDKPSLVVAPTGAGKTGIVSLLPYVLASPKAVILSPAVVITDQLEKAFGLRNDCVTESFVYERKIITNPDSLKDFLELGIRMTGAEEIKNIDRRNLVIVNAQKFGGTSSTPLVEKDTHTDDMKEEIRKLRNKLADFHTLIVDEAHHYPAATWDEIVKQFAGKQIVFLTATPFRGSECVELWEGQEITYRICKKVLEERKIIRPVEFRTLNCEEGDFRKLGSIIKRILQEHDKQEPDVKHKAMVLVYGTGEAKTGASEMGDIATYHTSEKSTAANLKNFENDKKPQRILIVCGTLLEGYDNSDVSVCIIHRNVQSYGLFTQFVGRCIRTSKGLKDRFDPVTAVIGSLEDFGQQELFDKYIAD